MQSGLENLEGLDTWVRVHIPESSNIQSLSTQLMLSIKSPPEFSIIHKGV